MSVLVELNRNEYPDTALDGFRTTSQFSLDNARAMMWLSQLAYETAHQPKVKSILDAWQLTMPVFVTNDPGTGLPPHSACVVGAAGRGATFFTFAGSDPLKAEDWVTDFNAMPSPDDLHTGFQKAVETVWPVIQAAITNRATPAEPLFFTGHSLGGALAILSAARAAQQPNVQKTVVYTFGSPRTGGQHSSTAIRSATPPSASSTAPTSCRRSRRRSWATITMSGGRFNARPMAVLTILTQKKSRPRRTSQI